MVPVSWAWVSADVNAGTARAARIAIIAITTSNSISVNAEEGLFSFIFIVGFFHCVVLRVALVAAIDLNRPGGSGEPPLPFCSQRVWFLGRSEVLFLRLVPRGLALRVRAAYRRLHG